VDNVRVVPREEAKSNFKPMLKNKMGVGKCINLPKHRVETMKMH
jgi:hypothetical protein